MILRVRRAQGWHVHARENIVPKHHLFVKEKCSAFRILMVTGYLVLEIRPQMTQIVENLTQSREVAKVGGRRQASGAADR